MTASLRDLRFAVHDVLDYPGHYQQILGDAAPDRDLVDAIISEAAKFCEGELAPINRSGDEQGCRLEDGVVQTDPVLDWILFAAMLASAAAFYIWFWCRSGQTLGMLAWRLRVQDYQGQLLTPGRAILRLALAWPSFFLFGLGAFFCSVGCFCCCLCFFIFS